MKQISLLSLSSARNGLGLDDDEVAVLDVQELGIDGVEWEDHSEGLMDVQVESPI